MQVFIWTDLPQVSDRYHSEGGVVVIAENEDLARELANKEEGCNISSEQKPTYSCETTNGKQQVFIFPDAGCC